MDYNEVLDQILSALLVNDGEMLYQDFQDSLPPLTQLALPRHFEKMRADGVIDLSVRFDAEALKTELFISTARGRLE